MLKRIIAIVAIFVCAAVAWAILGSTIFYRTYNAESGLSGRVASTWGAPQGQAPPAIAYEWPEEKTIEVEEKGKKITRTERQIRSEAVKIDASRVTATLHIDYRQKGLLWFSTYKVDFDGAYTFQNPSLQEEEFAFQLPFLDSELRAQTTTKFRAASRISPSGFLLSPLSPQRSTGLCPRPSAVPVTNRPSCSMHCSRGCRP